MKFGTDYWHSLDKDTARRYNLNANYIGISTPPFRDQLESLKTRIFQGASQVELGFTGRGKGSASQGSITPEQLGKEEREQVRLLAKLNNIELSTHTTVGVGSLSGFDERQNVFNPEAQEANMQEVRRTIDFAAETARGGPVVVHTGEFPRPIDKFKDEQFQNYQGEEEHAPVYLADPETGQVIPLRRDTKILEPEEWEDEAKRIPKMENGEIKFKEQRYKDIVEDFNKLSDEEKQNFKNDPGIYFYNKYADRQIQQLQGEQNRYYSWAEEMQGKDENQARYFREAALSHARQVAELKNQLARIQPIEQVGVQRSADALARAGIYAFQKEREEKLEKPLFIAPENIFPEMGYGSHPAELKNLIATSRERMQEKLWDGEKHAPTPEGQKLGIYSQQKAHQVAEDHIKATFDIGHLNTWKKYFRGTEEEYNQWVEKQIDTLTKDKSVGHAHITDNFGYFDEHVTPGEGTAPVAGFIKKLKESGYEGKFIIEPGAQDVKAWTGAMRSFNSPVYRINGGSASWTEVEGGYFSQARSPTYVVGGYSPGASLGEEYNDWRFWSRLPIE